MSITTKAGISFFEFAPSLFFECNEINEFLFANFLEMEKSSITMLSLQVSDSYEIMSSRL